MMEESFWISVLRKYLNNNQTICKYTLMFDIQIYLFGSACIKNNPNDLDVLLIYPSYKEVKEALKLKEMLIFYMERLVEIQMHVILLTIQENKEINFVQKEHAVKII